MLMDEMLSLFLASRRHGVSGAKCKARPATLAIYAHWLDKFVEFMRSQGVTSFEQIRKTHISAFLDWLEAQVWATATKLKVLRSVRALFRFASLDEDCQTVDGVQFRDWGKALGVIKKGPRREYIPTVAELKLFKNQFDTNNRWGHRDYAAFCLMLSTGMRVGEVCSLLLEGTKLSELTLYVSSGKTGSRFVPIPKDTARILKGWLRRRESCATAKDSPYVFVSKYTEVCTPQIFQKAFRQCGAAAGLPELTPHTLRHAFCTYYLQRGGSIDKLRNIVGHADYRMLLEYEHLAKVGGEAMKAEVNRVNPMAMLA